MQLEFIDNKDAFYRYLYQNCHCVNAGQSQDKRRLKYAIVRSFGRSSLEASKYRDWRDNCFAKWFGYRDWQSLIKIIEKGSI